MDFVEQLKSSVDIAGVIGEWVRLRKATSSRFVGLCPFHTEKTPSFSVNVSKQFFYCFGCHAKGDVIKFVMDIEGVSFYEALKSLAERYGIAMPKRSDYADADTKRRAAVFQMHEIAVAAFREHLQSPAGAEARAYVAKRGLSPETVAQFGLGYADRSGRFLLRVLEQQRFTAEQLEESGLVSKRQDGSFYDRFRHRLMFPIYNESGKAIAFGGRALSADDEPKYLNSPETPIYKKSYVLYNLHHAKDALRKEDRVILVEGYMDAIGVTAAGILPVVASCGTALTTQQVQALKRHTQRIVVNFDPDAPGANAAERSISLLLDEGMQVRIMELDGGLDPDEYCKERGADAYRVQLESARGYFYWLADRARARNDMRTTEGRVAVLQFLLPAVRRITDRLERFTVANEVASYIGVEKGMVLDSFRKAVTDREEKAMAPPKESLQDFEKLLMRFLLSSAPGREQILDRLRHLDVLQELASRRIIQAMFAVQDSGGSVSYQAVDSRLEDADRNLLAELLMASEEEERELTLEYGESCLKRLRSSANETRRAAMKAKVKEAERAGNFPEAVRLTQELGKLERAAKQS